MLPESFISTLIEREPWRENAACRGAPLNLFFREEDEPLETWQPRLKEALSICVECPVKTECLNSRTPETVGVWGGKNRDFPQKKLSYDKILDALEERAINRRISCSTQDIIGWTELAQGTIWIELQKAEKRGDLIRLRRGRNNAEGTPPIHTFQLLRGQ